MTPFDKAIWKVQFGAIPIPSSINPIQERDAWRFFDKLRTESQERWQLAIAVMSKLCAKRSKESTTKDISVVAFGVYQQLKGQVEL